MTRRQAEALAFIKAFIAKHGYSPSYREIAEGLGMASNSNVDRLVRSLAAQGYV